MASMRPKSATPSSRLFSGNASANWMQTMTRAMCDVDPIDDLILDDDDDEGDAIEFGAEALAAQRRMEKERESEHNNKTSRPKSAPVRRVRPQSATFHKSLAQKQEEEHERAAISIGYLKQAAEKKKQRDDDFARELLREEAEFKKKMQQKLDQANKMSAVLGSKRAFAMAPDRDGMHMVKVTDPASNDRVVSVENFLREFERMASVQIGQLQQPRTIPKSTPTAPSDGTTRAQQHNKSKHRLHGIRTSRSEPKASTTDLSSDGMKGMGSKSKRLATKATDRALVQEELKNMLASTIELTKILQDQLHELKLKGWNFSARTHASTG